MTGSRSSTRYAALLLFTLSLLLAPALVHGQSDIPRETVAITYPLDQSVTVRFRGTTRLPRLSGEAKVKRSGRRNTRVELSINNLPRASELGGVYTTFVLWAISPEGRADNLGEIKRSGSQFIDSKLDVTTPLQTFALIVTAEPHYLVRGPSRMVVLENLPPTKPGDADVATVNVRYLGNTSDYFNDPRVPEVADADFIRTPTSLLGARQAINLARYAGADRDAPNELNEATAKLAEAENAWRLKQADEEVDASARRAIDLGVKAEEIAQEHKAARLRREEIARRDRAVQEAERSADSATAEITELKTALERETHGRELSERDLANATQQVRDLRSEIARLRDELQAVRTEADDAKLRLARIEGERAAEQARKEAEQRTAEQRAAAEALRQNLAHFGSVRDTSRGLVLILPESIWTGARLAEIAPKATSTLEPLAALLANNPDYKVIIEAYTDSRGDDASLRQLTQARAEALAGRLVSAGVEGARIQSNGLGADNPLASNTTPTGRLRNRRTEITLIPLNQASTASAQ
jgi:outer membrane protein OmpA-like peptidoglycan-associated protein